MLKKHIFYPFCISRTQSFANPSLALQGSLPVTRSPSKCRRLFIPSNVAKAYRNWMSLVLGIWWTSLWHRWRRQRCWELAPAPETCRVQGRWKHHCFKIHRHSRQHFRRRPRFIRQPTFHPIPLPSFQGLVHKLSTPQHRWLRKLQIQHSRRFPASPASIPLELQISTMQLNAGLTPGPTHRLQVIGIAPTKRPTPTSQPPL